MFHLISISPDLIYVDPCFFISYICLSQLKPLFQLIDSIQRIWFCINRFSYLASFSSSAKSWMVYPTSGKFIWVVLMLVIAPIFEYYLSSIFIKVLSTMTIDPTCFYSTSATLVACNRCRTPQPIQAKNPTTSHPISRLTTDTPFRQWTPFHT